MSNGLISVILLLALSVLGVLADTVLKVASVERSVLLSKWFFVGIALSCAFATVWMFLMRVMKLATAGLIYGVVSSLLLCFIGVFVFEEKLTSTELAGVGAAMIAMVLLGRVAD